MIQLHRARSDWSSMRRMSRKRSEDTQVSAPRWLDGEPAYGKTACSQKHIQGPVSKAAASRRPMWNIAIRLRHE